MILVLVDDTIASFLVWHSAHLRGSSSVIDLLVGIMTGSYKRLEITISFGKGRSVSITISDEILASSGLTEGELRRELAIALFQAERLTLGQAAKLADQSQREFQKALASRRIPIHYGAEELDQDLQTVRRVPTH